jgi:hypothetical protein
MTGSRTWWAGALGYAALVAGLTLGWSRGISGFSGAEVATFLLTVPASLVTLPMTYVVLGLLWNITGADHGGPMWLVAAGYAVWFAAVAVANVCLARFLVRRARSSPHLDREVAQPRAGH